MAKNKIIKCPICKSNKAINMLDFNCGNLDDSTLYPSAKVNACEKCDQINYDPSVLVYSTNKKRAVGKINSNFQDLRRV